MPDRCTTVPHITQVMVVAYIVVGQAWVQRLIDGFPDALSGIVHESAARRVQPYE